MVGKARDAALKELLDKAEFNKEEKYFSVSLDKLTNFHNKYGWDFHKIMDSLSPEEKEKLLTPYFE